MRELFSANTSIPGHVWTFPGTKGQVTIYVFPPVARAVTTPDRAVEYLFSPHGGPAVWEHLTPRSHLIKSRPIPAVAPHLMEVMKRGKAVAGYTEDHGLLVVFSYEKRADPKEALEDIAQHRPDLPPELAVMVYTATQARAREYIQAPYIALATYRALLNHLGLAPDIALWRNSRVATAEIPRMADRFVDQLPALLGDREGEVIIPTHPLDTVHWMILLSRRLWSPRVLQMAAQTDLRPQHHAGALLIGLMAALHPMLVPSLVVTVGQGTPIAVQGEGMTVSYAWPQVVEFERGGIDKETYQHLTNGTFPDGDQTVDVVLPTGRAPSVSPDLKEATVRALLDEAEEGTFLPAGAFTLFLPRDYPLRAWGVSALRIVAYPDPPHLWVGARDSEGKTSACFRWDPGQPISRWVVADDAADVLELTLAALWHDLRVARERAFPERRKARRGNGEKKGDSRTRRETGGRVVQYLPRTVYRMRGRRDWGGEAEARAARRAHAVRAHLRHLPQGWKARQEAHRLARAYGYVLPKGYTFVRPHVRGRREGAQENPEDEGRETMVVARGLVTVMAVVGTPGG